MRIKKTKHKPILARERKPLEAAAETPVQRFFKPITKRWRLIAGIAAGVIVTAAIIGGTIWYRHDREDRAARAYALLRGKAVTRAEEAAKKAGASGNVDEDKLVTATIKDIGEFTARYGETGTGRAATYDLASIYFDRGDYKKASANFADVKSKAKGLEKTLAAKGIGDCYLGQGDYKRAIATYKEIYDAAPDGFPGVAVGMALAECYRHEGRNKDAAAIYRRVVDYNALSPFAAEAREELTRFEEIEAGNE